jgi:hypothetical protein
MNINIVCPEISDIYVRYYQNIVCHEISDMCQMLTSHRTPRMTDPVRREQQPQNAALSIILSTTTSAELQ